MNIGRSRLLGVALVAAACLTMAPSQAAVGGDGVARHGDEAAARAERAALAYLEAHAEDLGFTAADLVDAVVTDRVTSRHNGLTHVYLRQRLDGIEVTGAELAIHVTADGRVVHVDHRFVRNLRGAVTSSVAVLPSEQAVLRGAKAVGVAPSQPMSLVSYLGGASEETVFSSPELSRDAIRARQVYLLLDSGAVRLAWHLGLHPPGQESYWNLYVDAASGAILRQDDLVVHDTYQVYALPKESPSDGPRTLEVGVADPVASPFGWHDTDGIAGAEFTDTRGNNVFAQEDQDANNAGGFRPSGGPSLDFQFPLDFSLEPGGYQEASITNLFYWNNVLHDVHHHYGFDEASGNFQQRNYTGATGANDAVRADAQDGSGINNANFLTPPDGSPPRMQMYIWGTHVLEVNSPPAVAGIYEAGGAAFGAPLNATGLTDNVVAGIDATGSPTDGCEALTNAAQVSGNIALLDRGTCNFTVKVKNAQNAGAVGAIIVNNAGDDVMDMGGVDPTINVPSVFIGQTDGTAIRGALPGVNVNMRVEGFAMPNRDSSLDNGIIAHEYGHGVSNRLTGGKTSVFCLNGNQSGGMGEGWSDFWALALTAVDTDLATDARGIGTYVLFEPSTGPGIREFPYTTDLTVNPHTFADIASVSIPHGIGSVWTAMLWEVYWNVVEEQGFSKDFYTGTAGNNVMLQLVMDGLKLQGCSPRFTNARDAILAADKVTYENANHCSIWKGFAKRGLGFSADAGPNHNSLAVTEAFDLPPGCHCDLGVKGRWNHPTLTTPGGASAKLVDANGNQLYSLRATLQQTQPTGGTIVGVLNDGFTPPSPDYDVVGTWTYTSATAGRFSADIEDPVTGEGVGRIQGVFETHVAGTTPGAFKATWRLCH